MWKLCAYEPCGRAFETDNPRRIFCSARCRRSGQNAARRQARADARAFRESLRPMSDPWAVMTPDDGDGDIWSNALLDALPAGMEAERAVAFETAVTRRGRTESPALRSASEAPEKGTRRSRSRGRGTVSGSRERGGLPSSPVPRRVADACPGDAGPCAGRGIRKFRPAQGGAFTGDGHAASCRRQDLEPDVGTWSSCFREGVAS